MEPVRIFAQAVRTRRRQLEIWTANELAERMGVSGRLVNDIENARRDTYSNATLVKLDEALNWRHGSSKQLLDTGDVSLVAAQDYYCDEEGNTDGVIYTSGSITIESVEPECHEHFTISIGFHSTPAITTDDLIDLAHSLRREGNSVLAEIQKAYLPILDQGRLGKMKLGAHIPLHIAKEPANVDDDDLEWAACPHEETEIPYAE